MSKRIPYDNRDSTPVLVALGSERLRLQRLAKDLAWADMFSVRTLFDALSAEGALLWRESAQ